MSDVMWVAIITALATTIPQIVVVIINSRKDLKLKKYEQFNQKRLNAIFEFLDSVGSMYSKDGLSLDQKTNFQKSVNKLLLYFPNITDSEISKIFNSTKEWDDATRSEALRPLIKKLSKYLT